MPARKPRPNLGAVLCWAVVFADIGTSVYYTPGILFRQVGAHAALFVTLTLGVFVLLALKYAEVAWRYPHGGGVVSVGAHAVNNAVGLVGGLFILVDYFLTSALSALSGLIYLSLVLPAISGQVVLLTVVALMLLALLNLVGISADAKVTAVIAVVALVSQVLVVVAVLVHVGPQAAVHAAPKALSGSALSGVTLLTGYAGAFLAFSGLESISQLAPAMRHPNRRTAPRAMLLVIVTVALTSPALTLWATTLLHTQGADPNQFVSLLGGFAAGPIVQAEVAASAALLLVFAGNTAIIGCYHVFLALSRMRFLPQRLQARNRWRGTPHWAIAAATVVPVAVVIVSRGDTGVLGDMYAFGLLGAFSVTCVCLDIVRFRERKYRRRGAPRTGLPMFVLGLVTSVLVVTAWATNLVAKPLATIFGGAVLCTGLLVVGVTTHLQRRRSHPGVVPVVHRFEVWHPALEDPLLVLLSEDHVRTREVARAAVREAAARDVVFAFIGRDVPD
ncbi:MAG: APC family permease, partial [Candidatus Dormibacteraeota bacterium]|nr:APC family permease [Candidatus Dormibacteraeota bacterium]